MKRERSAGGGKLEQRATNTHVDRSSRISIRSAVSKEKADSIAEGVGREEEASEGDMARRTGGGGEGRKAVGPEGVERRGGGRCFTPWRCR